MSDCTESVLEQDGRGWQPDANALLARFTSTHPLVTLCLWLPYSTLPGVAGHAHRHWGSDYTESALYVRIVSMCMLSTSIVIACWSGYNFNCRANMLQ